MDAEITSVEASAYRIPTEEPESDGTLEWDSTTMIVVELEGGGSRGTGWTYGHEATVEVIRRTLRERVVGSDPMAVQRTWERMRTALRNVGTRSIPAAAVSAVDATRCGGFTGFLRVADLSRPGHGLELRPSDMEEYRT